MTAQSLNVRTALLLTLPPLLWASNAVAGRMLVGIVPPVMINAARWILALMVLLPLGWQAIGTPAARAQVLARWKPLALLGLTGVGAYNALQYVALTTSTPLNVTLITASSPVCMMIVGALFYGQRPTGRGLLGAALSLLGVALVLARGELASLAGIQFVPGDLLMLLAMLSWAFYSWMLAKPPASMAGDQRPAWDWWGFMLIQTLFGLGWAGGAALLEAALVPTQVHWSLATALTLVYIALGPSILAYLCWGRGVAAVGPSTAGFFINLTPLFAALLQALLLGVPPQAYHALAFALIVAGIVVSSRR
ncbi:DMT family transporter [Aquincola tertiaricarbonis]|uniref:DMT family transporter n=1 Tax=Aquincola tertiaricarbonis TaxID=391953 RepID=UPI00061529BC|nr:DMT family transporter [Aquincola tertiaricarbonis]